MFKRISSNIDLPKLEDNISNYWDKINAFENSMESRKDSKVFRFYDGPPFPTGSPHYGNLLAGVIKDIVPRYWTMRDITLKEDLDGMFMGFLSKWKFRKNLT